MEREYDGVEFVECEDTGFGYECDLRNMRGDVGEVSVQDVEVAGPSSPLQEFSTFTDQDFMLAMNRQATCTVRDTGKERFLYCE